MNNAPLFRHLTTVAAVCLALTVFACSSDPATGPGVEPEVTNMADDFQFQVTSVTSHSATWRYNWQTTATVANIDQSCAITEGAAVLTVRDNAGNQVYTQDLAADGSFQTEPGEAGIWQLEVSLTNATGTLNFRAQKNQ